MDLNSTKIRISLTDPNLSFNSQMDFRVHLTDRNNIKQRYEAYHSRIRSKINQKSYQLTMKLKNLLKKMQQENLIGDFLYNNMNLTAEQQFAFINTDVTDAELLVNMQLLYVLSKKIIIATDHLFNGILVRNKYLKYMIKLLKKILKVLNTYNAYFDPAEKGILSHELFCDVELDEFEDQFLQKIDYFMKVVSKKKKQGVAEVTEIEDHTEEKKQFIDKLPEFVKKARLEAEKTSFNEFDHKKGQFKEEIKVINDDLRELLKKHDNSMPNNNISVQNLVDKLYSNKSLTLLAESPLKTLNNKDEYNEALFEEMEDNSIQITEKPDVRAAKIIQKFWRNWIRKAKISSQKSVKLDICLNIGSDDKPKTNIDAKYADMFTREDSDNDNDDTINNAVSLQVAKQQPKEVEKANMYTKVVFLNSEILTKR